MTFLFALLITIAGMTQGMTDRVSPRLLAHTAALMVVMAGVIIGFKDAQAIPPGPLLMTACWGYIAAVAAGFLTRYCVLDARKNFSWGL